MPRKKINNKKRKLVMPITKAEVCSKIFSCQIPPHWRKGQFIFNMASQIYGDDFVRSLGHDPYYNNENINPFLDALTKALNKLN